MKSVIGPLAVAFALAALLVVPSVMAQQPNKSGESRSDEAKKDAQTACMEMMQGSGMTEEGKKATQAMNNMMEMARRMGNGDTMLGMTKMMEMMGGQGGMGGMMGGQASPGMHQPK